MIPVPSAGRETDADSTATCHDCGAVNDRETVYCADCGARIRTAWFVGEW